MNRGVLAQLRSLCPPRRLTHGEALRVAEMQANRLLLLAGVTDGPMPESVITDVPKISLRRISPWPVSGCTDWAKGMWVIVVNGAESTRRQRFTLAHEFKHIIDYPFSDVAYPRSLGMSRHQRTESTCDYFAGCLLVPRAWLKRAWISGLQDTGRLADHFGVSQSAVLTRLRQVGLVERQQRCPDVGRGWRFMRATETDVDNSSSPFFESVNS